MLAIREEKTWVRNDKMASLLHGIFMDLAQDWFGQKL
jgi:hypothetical protein